MKVLGKLLKEKLEAAETFVDASTYPTSVSAGNITWSGNSNNTKLFIPTGEQMEDVKAHIKQLDYILQRIVPNYDELVAQYRAIKDIEEAGERTSTQQTPQRQAHQTNTTTCEECRPCNLNRSSG